MKLISCLIFIIFLSGCSKPKTILICGDHECVNKEEANQYFEENLTLEVKIIDNKKTNKNLDLVELNLNESQKGDRKVSINIKEKTNEKIKTLSKEEKIKIKNKVKNKKKDKRISSSKQNKINNLSKKEVKIAKKTKSNNTQNKNKTINNLNKKRENVVDVCTILEKCNIETISTYLLNQGKNKRFPDITTRQ